jgi:ApbE superfamily uncharacterized protein (UPF0280 family)
VDATLRAHFPALLPALAAIKPALYQDLHVCASKPALSVPTAQCMVDACWPYRAQFITPMAAVAGAVADTLIALLMRAAPHARKLFVNNGGDIALRLADGESMTIGLVDDPQRPDVVATVQIDNTMGVGGVATSGWRGRSFSFGIADAVTVLAPSAAQADAAATMIANAVNAQHPAITRAPAYSVKDETDLGERLVTTHVGPLDDSTIHRALDSGVAFTERVLYPSHAAPSTYGAMVAAALRLQGHARVVPANVSAFALSAKL